MYAGSYCLACNRHIRIGIIYDWVSDEVRHYLDIFIATLGLLYMSALSWAAYGVAQKSLFAPWGDFRMETSGSAWDPALPAMVKSALFCVVLLMLFSIPTAFDQANQYAWRTQKCLNYLIYR